MEGKVKLALYALSEMQKYSDSWAKLASSYNSIFLLKYKGQCRRESLRRKTQGLVFHDRILNERSING